MAVKSSQDAAEVETPEKETPEVEASYPNFVEQLGGDTPPRTAEVMRDVFLRPGEEGISRTSELPPEERVGAYRELANIRAKAPKGDAKAARKAADETLKLFTNNQLVAGAVFDMWSDVEKTVEKYSSMDFPDAPAEHFKDAPEGLGRDLARFLPVILAGGAAGTVTRSAAPLVSGILKSLGPVGRTAHTMTALPARLLVGGPGRMIILSEAALLEGTEKQGPEFSYGLTSLAGKYMGLGESEEEREERRERYKHMWYGGRLKSQYISLVFDEGMLLGLGLGVRGLVRGGRYFKTKGGLSKKGVDNADRILSGREASWRAEHGEKLAMTSEEAEDFVAKTGASQFLSKDDLTVKTIETSKGKIAIAYKKLSDVDVPEPPPIPKTLKFKKGGDVVQGTSPRRVAHDLLDEASKVEGEGSLEKLDNLRSLFSEEMSRPGQRAIFKDTVTDRIERAAVAPMVNAIRKVIKEGPGADLSYYKQVLARVGHTTDTYLPKGAAKAGASHSGVELERLKTFKEMHERLHSILMDMDEVSGLPEPHLKFLEELLSGVQKGTVDPRDIATKLGQGGVKGALNWWGRQVAHNRLGERALLTTAMSNATGSVESLARGTALYGVRGSAMDAVDGTMQVARLMGSGVSHPLETAKNFYLRMTGEGFSSSIGARTLIEDTLPSSFFEKVGNAITGFRFEAIHQMDEVTKAFNSSGQARQAIGWITEDNLTRQGLKHASEEVFQKEYRKTVAGLVKSLRNGRDDSGILPLFYHLMDEGTSKIAFRRRLNKSAMTPIATKYHKLLYEGVEKLGTSRPDDSVLQAFGKFGVKSLLVPFSKTQLNISERALYGLQGMTGTGAKLGRFGNLDRELVGQSMAAGMLFYFGDTLYSTGLMTMAPPLETTHDPTKVRGMKGHGVPMGQFKSGGRTFDASGLSMTGQGLLLSHHIHAFYNSFKEDYPDEASRWLNPVMAFINTFGAADVLRGSAELVESIHYDDQGGNKETWQKIRRTIIDDTVEASFPFGKTFRNIREKHLGAKIETTEGPLHSVAERKKALDSLRSFYEGLRTRMYNAYGVEGFIQRDYFGTPVNTIHPEEYGGEDDGFLHGVYRYMMGGTGVVDKAGIEFYDQMVDMGLFDVSSKRIKYGQDQTVPYDLPTSKFIAPSRYVSVNVRRTRPDGQEVGLQESVKLPTHEYNRMKGLLGLRKAVWERFSNMLGENDRHVLRRVSGAYLRDLDYFGYKKGDELIDVVKRIAMWKVGNIKNAPPKLRHWLDMTADDSRYGANDPLYIKPGLTATDQLFNVAKRRAIVELYNVAKKMGRQLILLSPDVKEAARNIQDARGEQR